LPEMHNAAEVESKLAQFMYSRYTGYDQWSQSRKDNVKFSLRPFKSLYFDADRGGAMLHGNIQNVTIFTAIAFFVLCIAVINFINLSTATASIRGREVGIRKVLGTSRGQLIRQFLAESVFLIFMSSMIAIILVALTKERFFGLIGKHIEFGYLVSPFVFLVFILSTVFIGLISGLYPSIYLSAFQPADVLQRKTRKGSKGRIFREALIIVQFTISIILIIGTFVVGSQLEFIRNRDLGFDKNQVLWFEANDSLQKKVNVLKAKLREHPGVEQVATSNYTKPGIRSMWGQSWKDRQMDLDVFLVDSDYVKTMGLDIVEGRNFLSESDKGRAYILNESAVKEFGMDSPVGEIVGRSTVVGVVKDFHFRSLHHEIGPLLLAYQSDTNPIVNVRISKENINQTVADIKRTFDELAPGEPFDYHFFDESFDALYQREHQFEQLFLAFSILAILIACLGLFGLAAFMAEQRTKEIGIRKVLGASAGNVALLLSKEFVKWVVLANVIAWPVAYYAMAKWLANFAYRTGIEVWVFVVSGLFALLIALVTVSTKALRAAAANPTDSLRYE
jgi:putative ABC transport system permease protein